MTGHNDNNKHAYTPSDMRAGAHDTAPGFDPVALAERNFARVLSALDLLADGLDGGDDSSVAKAAKLASEARGAIQTIFTERQRIAKLDTDIPGASGGALDLDAARLEIGRRLALLRERGGANPVSGELE